MTGLEPNLQPRRRFGGGGRLLIALIMAGVAVVSYFGTRQLNPVTNEVQHVSMTADQEIGMGLQAAPEMEAEYGGLSSDATASTHVEQVGERIVTRSAAGSTPYKFQFHLLADPRIVNAFALPGGQVFITEGLLQQMHSEGELATVLAHEVGHVVARHSAQQLAKSQLTQGLTGAAVIATYDPNDPSSSRNAAVIAAVGQLVNMKFGRNDELQADQLGVRFASDAGYDPRAMIKVMQTLEQEGGTRAPEFFSTHPNPEHRIERIQQAIEQKYPNGVPAGLTP